MSNRQGKGKASTMRAGLTEMPLPLRAVQKILHICMRALYSACVKHAYIAIFKSLQHSLGGSLYMYSRTALIPTPLSRISSLGGSQHFCLSILVPCLAFVVMLYNACSYPTTRPHAPSS
jgi:hypothetical protein